MMDRDADPNESASLEEFRSLCALLLDGVISDSEFARLDTLLKSPAYRDEYLRELRVHQMLHDNGGREERLAAEQLAKHVDAESRPIVLFEPEKKDPSNQLGQRRRGTGKNAGDRTEQEPLMRWNGIAHSPWIRFVATTAAAIITMFVCTAWWMTDDQARPNGSPAHVANQGGVGAPVGDPAHVEVSYVSTGARWQDVDIAPSVGIGLERGDRVRLGSGAIELTYPTGVRLMLLGPADFFVNDLGGKLDRGRLIASVPETGHGFTVETPNGKVVDLGTEFGVAVDDFGLAEASVFEGKIEAFPKTANPGGDAIKVELAKGERLQWQEQSRSLSTADLGKFAIAFRDTQEKNTNQNKFLESRFRKHDDLEDWIARGDVAVSDSGLRLKSGLSAAARPYVITGDQFNPLEGSVRITCDVTFLQTESDENPTFSIMTRSSSVRGTSAEPWEGVLGQCLSCSFGISDQTQSEHLHTGVKLGADKPMSTLSWSGFPSPKPNTRYRLVMKDDGVNVSFSVFPHDNPSLQRTVVCRSLFQGDASHIALGGIVHGVAMIDHVEIVQEGVSTAPSGYREFSELVRRGSARQELEARILDSWAPENAQLLTTRAALDDGELNSFWRGLGDVTVDGEAVQIGSDSLAGKIDTWQPRPYLLSSQKVDLEKGAVTVTGKLTFSENFLSGYGATFSVMTRANDRHGSGDGWERSILNQGVRVTFWPAAVDREHCLEIHERHMEDTLTLLGTRAVEVSPHTRDYLFKVFDDGESIEMTLVSLDRPGLEMNLLSPTDRSLHTGFIGLESCWGSPVKVSDLHVYQTR